MTHIHRSNLLFRFCLVCIVTLTLPTSLLATAGKTPRSAPQDYYGSSMTNGLPETISRNTIFGELGGNGMVFSLNYERLIFTQMGIRVGAGLCSLKSRRVGQSFPVMVNYYMGGKYKFELGAGLVFLANFEGNGLFGPEASPLLGFTLGHKYQPLDGGFTLRISLTPFYSPSQNLWVLSGGLSFGHTF